MQDTPTNRARLLTPEARRFEELSKTLPREPNPEEVATLIVGGYRFEDWTSVWVQHRWTDSAPLFRFTCAEREPYPEPGSALLQFRTGDRCTIELGGQLAVTGIITIRQMSYDSTQHGVQLTGHGSTWWAARASIIDKSSDFDGMSFEQVARKILSPFPVGIKIIGTLDATPFVRLRNSPGDLVWNFLEHIAKPRGIVLGSDHLGNFLFIGAHVGELTDPLIEGYNILKMQCVISKEDVHSEYDVRGQTAASDEQSGRDASEQEASAPGSADSYSPLVTVAEQPVWGIAELVARANHEARWIEGAIVTATVVVQGWLTSAGVLWPVGGDVVVKSPMAMLDQTMKIMTATFTQDSRAGSLTTLELVQPWRLGDVGDWNVGKPGVPQEPKPGQAISTPAETPPKADLKDFPPGASVDESGKVEIKEPDREG